MKHGRTDTPVSPSNRTDRSRATRGRHAQRRAPGPRSAARMLGHGVGIVAMVATTAAFAITSSESQLAHAETLDQRPEARTHEPAEAAPRVQAAPPVVVDRSAKVSRTDERPSRVEIVPAPEPEPEPEPTVEVPDQGADSTSAGPTDLLTGCDVEVGTAFANGQVPSEQLCAPWDGAQQVRADAAQSLAALNQAYTARFGESMCLTDGYRSYDQQVATKAAKGYLAAQPGYSNHGWGLAVDLCAETYAGERWDWLAGQAQDSGWDNPDWARPGGSKYEPWHWEFTDAVAEQS